MSGPKSLPNSDDPEAVLVAGALISPALATEAAKLVSPDDLTDERLRLLWGGIVALLDAGTPPEQIDVFSVASHCVTNPKARMQVAAFASKLLDGFPRYSSLVNAAQRVHRRATLRLALEGMRGLAAPIKDSLASPGGNIEDLESRLVQLSVDVAARSDGANMRTVYHDLADDVTAYFDQLTAGPLPNSIPTGIAALDKRLGGGLRPGQLHTVAGVTGFGKCLGRGTPVLMFDGTIKRVEQVRIGDFLMGPDSKPRRVSSTTIGVGPLYRVTPKKGTPWTCNEEHVLTLVDTRTNKWIDITVRDYLSRGSGKRADGRGWRHCMKQFSMGVEFQTQPYQLPVDPYFLGLWFGDGTKDLSHVAVTTTDDEVVAACHTVAQTFGLSLRAYKHKSNCPIYYLETGHGLRNPLLDRMRWLLGEDVVVPQSYLTARRSERLAFLAGWLDSDGHKVDGGCYDFVQRREDYVDAVRFLARSLGLKATVVAPRRIGGRIYHRTTISGNCDDLPTRLPRKRPWPNRADRHATRTGISVVPIGPGEYFGFTLDGDGHFLLGDFTVTHNTALASQVADYAATHGHRTLMFSMEIDPVDVYIRDVEREAKRSRWDLRSPFLAQREGAQADLVAAQSRLLARTSGKVVYGEPVSVETIRQLVLTERLRTGPVSLVVVDHAQVAKATDNERKQMPRYLEVKAVAVGLRLLARKLGVAVVLTAQMNPPPKGEAPTMFFIRESKDIVNASDVVLLIWHEREEVGDETSFTRSWLIMDKIRAGATGKIPVRYNGRVFTFEDMADPHATWQEEQA